MNHPAPPASRRAQRTSHSATARRLLGMPEPEAASSTRTAGRTALDRVGGPVGLAVAAAPTVAFVAVDATSGLAPALAAAGATAVAAGAVRVARREPTGAAVAGLVVAAVCAGSAALAGEARAFFLPTMLLPVVFVVAYAVTFALRRPLMGLMVNPLSGGPRDWQEHPALRRVYTVSSVVGLTLATANLVVRVVFYVADQPTTLGALQVGVPVLFAVHFAVTLVAARRAAPSPVPTTR
ncbi:DUF3159 domain-containing protein [Kineococcus terrestris]|uniref:DUF3159 domain-containing protein n=1 Tax=Kineococcus terrestris TaxID=2044856 RepID=UPI0034DAE235